MKKDEAWQPASINTFQVSRESPYLDKDLSHPNSQQSYSDKLKSGYEDGLKKAEEELREYRKSFLDFFRRL